MRNFLFKNNTLSKQATDSSHAANPLPNWLNESIFRKSCADDLRSHVRLGHGKCKLAIVQLGSATLFLSPSRQLIAVVCKPSLNSNKQITETRYFIASQTIGAPRVAVWRYQLGIAVASAQRICNLLLRKLSRCLSIKYFSGRNASKRGPSNRLAKQRQPVWTTVRLAGVN